MCDDCCDDCCDCCDGCDEQTKIGCIIGWSLCGVLSLLMMIMFPLSVSVLEPLYYGFEYDANSKQINKDRLYYSGRYWLGLGRYFIEFPRYERVMLFSDLIPKEKIEIPGASAFSETSDIYPKIYARSIEGMKVSLSTFISYKLTTSDDTDDKRQQLLMIYDKFEQDWQSFIRLVVQSQVRNTFQQYSVPDIPGKRREIEQQIFDQINEYLSKFFIKLKAFQILNFAYATDYEFSISQMEVVKQEIKGAEYTRATRQVQADTSKYLSEVEKEIRILRATKTAQVLYLQKEAESEAIKLKLGIYQKTLRYIQESQLFSGQYQNDFILDYLYIYVLQYGASKDKLVHPLNLPATLNT